MLAPETMTLYRTGVYHGVLSESTVSILLILMESDDPLIATSPKRQCGVELFLDKPPIHKDIDVA